MLIEIQTYKYFDKAYTQDIEIHINRDRVLDIIPLDCKSKKGYRLYTINFLENGEYSYVTDLRGRDSIIYSERKNND